MPDTPRRALLVIDVQKEYFPGGSLPVTHPADSLPRILNAMDEATRAGIPVVVVRHSEPDTEDSFQAGTEAWQLRPEVEDRPRSHLVDKRLPGSFTDTDLEAFLRSREVDTVVISGYMTQMCCDTTARQAAHMGLGVEFLSDATGTLDHDNAAGRIGAEELHRGVLVTQQSGFARVISTEEWITRL